MQLRDSELILRPWQKTDLPPLVKLANNPLVARNLRDRFPHPYTDKDGEWWIDYANKADPLENFAIEFEGHAVGGIGLMLGDDVYRRTAEIGYWLGEPYWGRGIAARAAKLMTEYGFTKLGLTRIFAAVFETNPASGRVLEKAGYTFEGRQPRAVFKGGRVLDQLLYATTR